MNCLMCMEAHLIEDSSKTHNHIIMNPEIYGQNWNRVINYLHNYNSDLNNLKKKIVSSVTEHVAKIKNDVYRLSTKIDAMISKNNQKIIDLRSIDLTILENMTQLQADSLNEFTKNCERTEIPDECIDIKQAEISEWNESMTNFEISKIPTISCV